jgi:hypothetical protein
MVHARASAAVVKDDRLARALVRQCASDHSTLRSPLRVRPRSIDRVEYNADEAVWDLAMSYDPTPAPGKNPEAAGTGPHGEIR